MRKLLSVTAALEAGTGIALVVAPSPVALALLGSPLDSPAGDVIGRILGSALFSLGSACWFARGEAHSLIAAMMLYNIGTISVLGYARVGLRMSGVGLWPAVLLHSALAVWCAACLRIRRRAL
jgi:hypothetical protein